MSRFLCITCLLLNAPAAALGISIQAGDARVVGAQEPGQTPGLAERADQLQAENARLTKQHDLDMARKRRYQALTLAGLLLVSFLSIVLYLSRRRLRRANLQLKEQVESNNLSQQRQDELTVRVAQAERMESLGSLAGGIAHDFNNLLVGVVCNAEVLQMYHEQTPDSKKCLDGILKAAETASALSRKMLAYAGRQPSEKRPVDLNEVVQPIVSLVQSGLINADIKFIPSSEPAIANVDSTQIKQIVLNLVHNANEAIGAGEGMVHVSITEEHIQDSASDPHLLGKAVPSGDYVAIEVRDNGPGIDAADISRMFEPFQSSRPERGRGLGLAVAYGHVNRHEGLIRVQSQVGHGTTIRILLPRSQQPAAPDQVVSGPHPLSASGTLLFVDDEEIIRDVASRFMSQVEWTVINCADGAEAIDWLNHNPDTKPDCICLDVVMPKTSGPQVLRHLQTLNYDVPVIVMSGYSKKNLQEFLQHEYVSEFLPKPFNTQQLIAAVSRATLGNKNSSETTSTATSSPKSPSVR